MYIGAWREGMTRDKTQTVSEWADAHRFLSEMASAEPGRWRTSRTPYLKEIMDCLSPGCRVQRVIVMAGAQLGKTECGNNWLGHIIHRTPGPMLYVEPTLDVVKKVSRQRITPMIEATPVLTDRVAATRSRDSGNTVHVKEFRGGLLLMTGANSAAGLRSMPIRFLFCDEVDEYPGDVDGQGDPVALAEKRTATYARRKILQTSTPTVRGVSRIEREYLASDQRKYFIPCPECGHMDYLQWTIGGWRGNEGRHHHIVWKDHDPKSVVMCCASCDAKIQESQKTWMLLRGEWRATNPEPTDGKTAGFHISSLYSPLGWKTWAECAKEFWDAKDDPFRLKTWVNTVLGETWEDQGDAVEAALLKMKLEAPGKAEVPNGVGVLVASVDVQGDRLEAQVVGFGEKEESWLIAFEQILGDPSHQGVWSKLDLFLQQPFEHESGRVCHVELTMIDSGGAHTEQVYRYCKARLTGRKNRRVFPIKGGTVSGRPLVERPSLHNRYHVPLYVLCVDTGKDIIMGRLQMPKNTRAPGYIHLPDWVDDEYLEQLASERAIRKYVKGRGSVRSWQPIRDRNEALDLTVYSLAALYACGPAFIKTLGARAEKWAVPIAKVEAPKGEDAARVETLPHVMVREKLSKKKKGWVTGY
jgi:phage terminase large subunit GpA-like protein